MGRRTSKVVWKGFPEHKPVTERKYCICIEDNEFGDTDFDTAIWFRGKWMLNGHDVSSEVAFWLDSEPMRKEVVC